jgi:glycosyltransferase involved in cell wall biosynthesis
LPEVGGDAALYCDPENTDDMVVALEEIVLNPEKQKLYREKGLERASQFPWENTAKKTWKVIES